MSSYLNVSKNLLKNIISGLFTSKARKLSQPVVSFVNKLKSK